MDGTVGSPFEQRDADEAAKIVDLTHVLDKVAYHFANASDSSLESDLKVDDTNALWWIFVKMAEYYKIEREMERGHADAL